MVVNTTLPNWYDVYPQGTKEGDEEAKFFKALARNPNFKWRSTAAIAKESGLTKKRVEEIINKYVGMGIVIPSKKSENSWAYWQRVPKTVNSVMDKRSIGQKDKDKRISAHGCGCDDECLDDDDE